LLYNGNTYVVLFSDSEEDCSYTEGLDSKDLDSLCEYLDLEEGSFDED